MKPSSDRQTNRELPRVAVMISQDEAVSHHVDTYYGIQQWHTEHLSWQLVHDPFADETLKSDPTAYDGVIARTTPLLYEVASKRGIPVVNVWMNSPVWDRLPGIYCDYGPAGVMAAEHLLARGFRQFGMLGYHNERGSQIISRSFRERLAEEGFSSSQLNISIRMAGSRSLWRRGCERIREWIQEWERPIGVLASYDQPAQTLANLARVEFGIAIPHELALIGVGNEPARCDQPTLRLTSIDFNQRQVGRLAAEMLDGMLRGESAPQRPVWIGPSELLARQSTDAIAVEDSALAAALRYIAENCHLPIQVGDVADELATSLRSLQQRFSDHLGRSISQQIEQMRIERLKRLILHSDEPIKTLAHQCGFRSMNTVHRAFLRSEGITPKQFRDERA